MLDRLNPESLFLAHLEWIEKVATSVCRRNSVWGDDAEDFASLAKMKLIEHDYAAFREFRGEAELTTYLTVVVVRLFHEYGRERWGRWRCSAAAERSGQLAKDLETLVYRDGFRLEEAGEKLRTAGKTTASDAELARILAQLKVRPPLRPERADPDLLDRAPADEPADGRVLASEAAARRRAILAALNGALDRLEPEERIIVRMHFADGRKVADVERALGLEPKALYRPIERLRKLLRRYLEEAGVSAADVRELLEGEEEP
jgi:RNA polymerase sigma factor (sigma-70 family)